MTITLEEIDRMACPWKLESPKPAPELVEALDRLFDKKGKLTEEGMIARFQSGTYYAYCSEPWL
jgi:hypothetical protein